jgi:hypothetical protein
VKKSRTFNPSNRSDSYKLYSKTDIAAGRLILS